MSPQAIGLAIIGLFGSASVGAAIVVGNIIIGLGTSLALSGVSKLLQKRPSTPSVVQFGSQITVRQPISSWRVIYGTVNTAGVMTYVEVTNSGVYFHAVLTLAGHEVHSIGATYFDGVMVVDASGTTLAPYASGAFYGNYIILERGLAGGPYPGLEALSAGLWTSAHVQQGRAGVHIRLAQNPTLFPSGVPSGMTWDVEGKEVLDIRLSPPSAVFTDNPALCIRDYLKDSTYGMACNDDEIDDESFVVAANICDEPVELRDSGSPLLTEKRYTCNGIFETSETPANILQALLSCCAGRLLYSNGTYKLHVGAYVTPNPDAITLDDMRGTIALQTRASMRDTFNGVKGLYISAANKWQPSDFPPYQNSDYVTEDQGKVRWKEVEYPFTTSIHTAQRLAKIELERNRRQTTVMLPCKFSRYDVAPLDVFPVTNERFGWTDKTFEAIEVKFALEEDDNGSFIAGVDIQGQETDAAVYAWDQDTDETIVDASGTVILPVARPPVTGSSNRAYRPLTNPLTATDAGADATINVDDFTMRISGLLDTPYDAGAITGLDFNTLYYVYFDDPLVEGGTVTYVVSEIKEDVIGDGRFFLGSCRTPVDGGPDTIGNDDGGAGGQTGIVSGISFNMPDYVPFTFTGGATVYNPSTLSPSSPANVSVTNPQNATILSPDDVTYCEMRRDADGLGSAAELDLLAGGGNEQRFGTLLVIVRFSIPTNSVANDGSPKVVMQVLRNFGEILVSQQTFQGGVTAAIQNWAVTIPAQENLSGVLVRFLVQSSAGQGSGVVILRLYGSKLRGTG